MSDASIFIKNTLKLNDHRGRNRIRNERTSIGAIKNDVRTVSKDSIKESSAVAFDRGNERIIINLSKRIEIIHNN